MDEEAVGLEEAVFSGLTLLRGIFAEVRAMRLESKGRAVGLSEGEKTDLAEQIGCADEVALFFLDDGPNISHAQS